MSLSKVHRAQEYAQLKEVRYASFDTGGNISPLGTSESGQFDTQTTSAAREPSNDAAFTKGRQEGLKEAETNFAAATQTMVKALEEISRLRESILCNSSTDMLRLVLSICRQVIHREVSSDNEIILKTIDLALQAAVKADRYTISIHPDDLTIVEERKPLFMASVKSLDNIVFKTDESLDRGGCLIESDLGQVDASIAGQLDEVEKTLLDSLENH